MCCYVTTVFYGNKTSRSYIKLSTLRAETNTSSLNYEVILAAHIHR